jgi:ATP/maltotriose-dependent transcriptional regulator MalT
MFVSNVRRERYGFGLSYVRAAETRDECYDLLGVIEVDAAERTIDEYKQRLRPWALAVLANTGRGFGRYDACFAILDEYDELGRMISCETIDWSGAAELAPAG